MSQYGGMQGAVDRYKKLMMLPEAAALPKGVSIDAYSTYRATPVFGAGLRGGFEKFFVVLGASYFSVQGTKGGVYREKACGRTGPTFLELVCFLWFVPTNRLPACRYRKIRGDDSAPPRNGGSYRPR